MAADGPTYTFAATASAPQTITFSVSDPEGAVFQVWWEGHSVSATFSQTVTNATISLPPFGLNGNSLQIFSPPPGTAGSQQIWGSNGAVVNVIDPNPGFSESPNPPTQWHNYETGSGQYQITWVNGLIGRANWVNGPSDPGIGGTCGDTDPNSQMGSGPTFPINDNQVWQGMDSNDGADKWLEFCITDIYGSTAFNYVSGVTSKHFLGDSAAPTLTSQTPSAGIWSKPQSVTLQIADQPTGSGLLPINNSKYQWNGGGLQTLPVSGSNGSFTATIPAPLTDGDFTLSLSAVDQAGNVMGGGNQNLGTYKFDSHPPSICVFAWDFSSPSGNDCDSCRPGAQCRGTMGSGNLLGATFNMPIGVNVYAHDYPLGGATCPDPSGTDFSGMTGGSAGLTSVQISVNGTAQTGTTASFTSGSPGGSGCFLTSTFAGAGAPYPNGLNVPGTNQYVVTANASDAAGNTSTLSSFPINVHVSNYKPGAFDTVNTKVIDDTHIQYAFGAAQNAPSTYKIVSVANPTTVYQSGNSTTLTALFPNANFPAYVFAQGCDSTGTCFPSTADTTTPNFTSGPSGPLYTFAVAPTLNTPQPADLTPSGSVITWKATWNANSNPTYTPYEIFYQAGTGSPTPSGCLSASGGTSSTLSNLQPNTSYTAWIVAFNGIDTTNCTGVQAPANPIPSGSKITFTTPALPPANGPSGFTALSNTSIQVTYTEPAGTYFVKLVDVNGAVAGISSDGTITGGSGSSNGTINNLNHGTSYTAYMCTHSNAVADGTNWPDSACNSTASKTVWTKFDGASAVLVQSKATPTSFHLTITSPQKPVCALVSYSGSSASSPFNVATPGQTMDVDVTPAVQNSQYTVASITVGGGTCQSGNDSSATTNSVSITAYTLPQAPSITSLTPQSPNASVQVNFQPQGTPPSGQTYYIKVMDKSGGTLFNFPNGSDTSNTSVLVNSGLQSGTSYEFAACTHSIDPSVPDSNYAACSNPQTQSTKFAAPTLNVIQAQANGKPASFHAVISIGNQSPNCASIAYTPLGGSQQADNPAVTATSITDDVQGTFVTPDTEFTNLTATIGAGNCTSTDQTAATSSPAFAKTYTPPAPPSPSGPTMTGNGTNSITAQYNLDPSNPQTTKSELEWAVAPANGDCSTVTTFTATTPKAQSAATGDTILGLNIGTSYCVRTVTVSSFLPGLPTTGLDQASPAVLMATQFNKPGPVLQNNVQGPATPGTFGVIIPLNGNISPQFAELDFSPTGSATTYHVMLTLATNCTPDTSGNLDCSVPVGTAIPTLPTPFSNTGFTNLIARFTTSASYDVNDKDPFSNPDPAQTAWTTPAPTLPPTPRVATPKTMSADFNFANNPPSTQYFLQADLLSGNFTAPVGQSPAVNQGPNAGLANAIVTVPQSGQSYNIRILVKSGFGAVLDTATVAVQTGTQFSQPAASVDPNLTNVSDSVFSLIVVPFSGDAAVPPPFVEVAADYDEGTGAGVQTSTTSALCTVSSGLSSCSNTNFDSTAKQLQVSVPIPAPQPSNLQYSRIQVRVGASANDADPSWSGWTTIAGQKAYTRPTAIAPTFQGETSGTITENVTYPPFNYVKTAYELQASNDPANFDPTTNSQVRLKSFTSPSTQAQVTGLTGGLSYYMRVRAISVSGNTALDAFSTPLDGPHTTDIAPGTQTFIGISSATVQWTVPNLSDALQLEAIANVMDGSGNSAGTPQPIVSQTSPVQLTVINLQTANTTYTFTLEKQTTASGTTWIPYSGSTTTVFVHAAPPPQPSMTFSGNAASLVLNVTAVPDANNAADSLYGIKVSTNPSDPRMWKYLQGDGTMTTKANYQLLSQWTPTTSLVNNPFIPVGTTYTVETVVVDKASGGAEIASPVRVLSAPGAGVTPTILTSFGVSWDDFQFGAPTDGPFLATFSTDINSSLVAPLVTLTPVNDPSAVVTVTLSKYDPLTQTASFVPTKPLTPATLYQMTIAPGVPDSLNLSFSTQISTKQFVSALNPSVPATVYSLNDTNQSNSLTIGQNIFSPDSFAVLRTAFIQPAATADANSLNNAIGSSLNLVVLKKVEVLLYNNTNGTAVLGTAAAPVSLTLSGNATGGAGALSSGGSQVDMTTLTIYQYIAGKGLVPVSGSVNNGNGSATAQITNSGVYFLAGNGSTDLSGALVYPVPFRPSQGHTTIKFDKLANDSTIKVYTIMGEEVVRLHNDNGESVLQWNVKNMDGDNVASGVYIYQIKNNYSEKRGKLIIIR